MTELSHTFSERHTADFEMIANGGFAPLTGFQGSEDWNRVCAEMRTATGGEYWPIPITLATELECAVGDVVELASDEGKPLGASRWRRSSSATVAARPSRSTAPTTRPTPGWRRSTRRATAAWPGRSRPTPGPTTRRASGAAT